MSVAQASYSQSVGSAPQFSPVQSAVNTLAGEQSDTHDLITNLENRLDSVLRGRNDLKPGPQSVRSNESELHGLLNERCDNAEGINSRLRSLLERLTV